MDVLLIVLVVVFAINGYRQGFVIGILSFVGFFGGAVVGLQLAPEVAKNFESPGLRILIALVIIFSIALLLQAGLSWLGGRLRDQILDKGAKRFDDIGGAVVSVIAVLVVTWMVAAPLGSSSVPWLSRA
ncbi:MAG: CvpA family protein, partial [Longispora sp.]|nr:CvpA family protein [Longispora sp. (in: high G+C Gram-positive bacteria)]